MYNCEATSLQLGTLSSTDFLKKKKLQNFRRLARKSQNVNSDNITVGRRSVKIKLPAHFAPPAFLRLLSPIKYLKQMCNKTLDNDFFQSHFVMYFFKVSVTRSSTIQVRSLKPLTLGASQSTQVLRLTQIFKSKWVGETNYSLSGSRTFSLQAWYSGSLTNTV